MKHKHEPKNKTSKNTLFKYSSVFAKNNNKTLCNKRKIYFTMQ